MEMSFYLLLGLSPVVMKGYDFDQVGGNDGHAGVLHKFSRVAGAYPPPPHVVKTRDPFDPSCAKMPLASATCPKKKTGTRARHGLRAPCQRIRIEFEADWGRWEFLPRAYFSYTPVLA